MAIFPCWPVNWIIRIPFANADSGFIDPNGDGATGSWSATPTGTFYTTVDEAIRQPTSPTTTDYISGVANVAASINFRMSSLINVGSVSQVIVWVYHNDVSNGLVAVQLYDDDETTTRSDATALPKRTTDTWDSVTFSGLSLTQAQLDSLTVRLTASKSGGGATSTIKVSAVYADITYSVPVAVSISLTTDGIVGFGYQAENTTRDTTSTGLNHPETISVDTGPANLDVRSTTFSDGSNTWVLGSLANGSDQVFWEFSNNDGTGWTTFAAADTNYTFDTNVAQSATRNLSLRLTTPTGSSSLSQHSATITIVASSP